MTPLRKCQACGNVLGHCAIGCPGAAPAAPGDADEALDLDKLMAALSLRSDPYSRDAHSAIERLRRERDSANSAFDAEVNEHTDYITGAKARIAALEERHTALSRALRRVEGADTLTAATVFAHCALDYDDWYARQLIKGKRGE